MKTVLVTGAAGFLGSHLCEYFMSQGFCVIAIDNFCTGQRSNQTFLESLNGNMIFLEEDIIQSWLGWESSIPKSWLEGLKYIFHFASPASPLHYQRLSLETMWANSIGLGNAISFAKRHGAKVIFASTSEIYGEPQVHPQPESYWGNVNSHSTRACYNESKRFGEALIFSENKKHGTRHGILRIFNTYGPRMGPNDGRVIINFLQQAIKHKPLTIFGSGLQTRTFCYVSDLIKGIHLYAERDLVEPINLGGQEEYTVLELAEIIQRDIAKSVLPVHFSSLPENDPVIRKPDLSKALDLLKPWQPEVSLQQGIHKVTEWLKSCEPEA